MMALVVLVAGAVLVDVQAVVQVAVLVDADKGCCYL
jgi:hypothetical protein